jgi:hypothetical protein
MRRRNKTKGDLVAHTCKVIILLSLVGCGSVTPPESPDGRPDAASDPDAARTPAFDVAYGSAWRFSVSGPTGGFVSIINRGPVPLSMSGLQVASVSDDHPTASIRIIPNVGDTTVGPGLAGGALSPIAEGLIDPLVDEPRTDVDSDYLSIELVNAPSGDYDIAASLTIELDGSLVDLPIFVHVEPGPTIWIEPTAAARATAFRAAVR